MSAASSSPEILPGIDLAPHIQVDTQSDPSPQKERLAEVERKLWSKENW